MASPKSVVVLGGGFAGAMAARRLDANPAVKVTIISDRPFVYVKYGGLRAAAVGGGWIDRTLVPLAKVVKKGKVVIGQVVAVDGDAKTVQLADGTKVSWDVLICATGSRSKSMAEPPEAIASVEGFHAFFDKTRAALTSYKNILVAGGGPVAVEFAGEVRAAYPQHKITLVVGKAGLFGTVRPAMSASFIKSATDKLNKLNIEVVVDDYATPAMDEAAPFVVPPTGTVKLASGKELKADVVFFGLGVSLRSTSIYPAAWQDPKTKELIVERNFMVKGRNDVYAAGDVAKTSRTKLGYLAAMDGEAVAKNVAAVVAGKPAKATFSPPSSTMMVVPMGPSHGRGHTPIGTFKDWTVSAIKGKDLFEGMMWKTLAGEKAPKAPKP